MRKRSAARLVTSTFSREHVATRSDTKAAAAATCSKLSNSSSTDRSRSEMVRASRSGRGPVSVRPKAWAMAEGTRPDQSG